MTIMRRLKRMMPEHIQPNRMAIAAHLAAMEKISQEKSHQDAAQYRQERLRYLIGRSGLSPLHRECSFENFLLYSEKQQEVRDQAIKFVNDFGSGFGGFIFSGSCGTGKNHLAAAFVTD